MSTNTLTISTTAAGTGPAGINDGIGEESSDTTGSAYNLRDLVRNTTSGIVYLCVATGGASSESSLLNTSLFKPFATKGNSVTTGIGTPSAVAAVNVDVYFDTTNFKKHK